MLLVFCHYVFKDMITENVLKLFMLFFYVIIGISDQAVPLIFHIHVHDYVTFVHYSLPVHGAPS